MNANYPFENSLKQISNYVVNDVKIEKDCLEGIE